MFTISSVFIPFLSSNQKVYYKKREREKDKQTGHMELDGLRTGERGEMNVLCFCVESIATTDELNG